MADLLDSYTPTAGAAATPTDAGRAAAAPPAPAAHHSLRAAWEAVRAGGWRLATLPLLAVALCVAVVLATAIGAVAISPLHTAAILLNQTRLFHFAPSWPQSDEIILLQLRLPRVAGAALVGAALGVSGALFQGLLRNPLADPLLLGSSAGAALGATLSFLLPAAFTAEFLGFSLVTVAAFAGALLAVALVYRLATRRGQTPVVTLLLAGVAITSILAAVQTLLVTLNDRLALRITSLYLWNAGGVAVRDWAQVQVVLALVLAGVAGALYFARALDAFALGEGMARAPGRACGAGQTRHRRRRLAAGGCRRLDQWAGQLRGPRLAPLRASAARSAQSPARARHGAARRAVRRAGGPAGAHAGRARRAAAGRDHGAGRRAVLPLAAALRRPALPLVSRRPAGDGA